MHASPTSLRISWALGETPREAFLHGLAQGGEREQRQLPSFCTKREGIDFEPVRSGWQEGEPIRQIEMNQHICLRRIPHGPGYHYLRAEMV